ncbi:uncharacterized protein LOC126969437 isoform X2 [Leptidea sinapis]|uniref:uncharacterized protein LOC126969437 isoform X2 n=1 Tax=Leptidea sinapis TaxID=189913 RepID=UPI0021337ECA|nr:uncharacterized protein LOC126969437 isoform X2 [Leptidea sinapis]
MDPLECLGSCDLHKKSRRVRSWYMYEQYKTLEKNQYNAARKLRDKSYQDLLLHQELQERRARRRLSDQDSLSQSYPLIDRFVESAPCVSPLRLSTNDFFQSSSNFDGNNDFQDINLDNLQATFDYETDVITGDVDTKLNESTDSVKNDSDVVTKSIADNINQQFETVKENIESLEKYTKFCDEGKLSDEESFLTPSLCTKKTKSLGDLDKIKLEYDSNTANWVWSKLVAFSYKVMRQQSGNLYYDYSTQVLTAVLACDIIRRSLGRLSFVLSKIWCL